MLGGRFNFGAHVTCILIWYFSGFKRCKSWGYGCSYLVVKETTDVHMGWMGGRPCGQRQSGSKWSD